MKKLMLALALSAAPLFASGAFDTSIRPQGIVPLDLDATKISLWISYPGDLSNVCGIKLKAASFLIDSQSLLDAVEMEKGTLTPGKDALLEATLYTGKTVTYGMFVVLKTKSGGTFGEAVDEILAKKTSAPESESRLLVAEAKLCH